MRAKRKSKRFVN